jgi:MIP family channel proteins
VDAVLNDPRKLLAELLGTFTLVFGGLLSILAAIALDGPIQVAVALGFGLSLLAGLYAFGEISGGHFNPAVSLAFRLSERLSTHDLIGYWIAQFVGGVLGALAVVIAFSSDDVGLTATQPSDTWEALWLEFLLTMIFVAVILQSSRSERVYGTALIAIPLTLVAVHLAAIPFSGASVNPARSFASALVGGEWDDLWIYFVGPLAGGAVAAFVHRYLYPPAEVEVEADVAEVETETRAP